MSSMGRDIVKPYFLLALLVGSSLLAAFILKPFITPLVLAMAAATILSPLYRRMRARAPRWPSGVALGVVVGTVVSIVLPLSLVGWLIVGEASSLYRSFEDGAARLEVKQLLMIAESAFSGVVPAADGLTEQISQYIDTYTKEALLWVISHASSVVSGLASFLLSLFVFLVALYYLLRDGERVVKRVVELSPLSDEDDEKIIKQLERAVRSVIQGNLTIALIQGTLTGIGFWICGVPNFVVWGTVAFMAALVPGVGTALVFVPAIFFLFVTGHFFEAMGLLAWGVAAVGLIDNMLGPKLIGRGVGLHPLAVLLSVLGGLFLFGPIGLFLGPLAVSLLFALLSIYSAPNAGARRSK